MWIATEHGWFSIVRSHENRRQMLVRARDKQHIDNILQYMDWRAKYEIIDTPNNDYPYRIIVESDDATDMISDMAEDINYSNFKEHVGETHGHGAYLVFLHDVWARARRLTRTSVG